MFKPTVVLEGNEVGSIEYDMTDTVIRGYNHGILTIPSGDESRSATHGEIMHGTSVVCEGSRNYFRSIIFRVLVNV